MMSSLLRKTNVAFLAFVLALALVCIAPISAIAEENQVNPYQRPDSSFIYDTLISDIASADSYLDGQTVQVTGEAVGEAIHEISDPNHCWVTVQAKDGSYAQVAVFMSPESASLIDTFGAYGKRGTTLQVRGTFNLACAEHEGLSDIHADSVVAVEQGQVSKDEFQLKSFVPGAVLMAIGLVLVVIFYRVKERQR